MRSFKSLAPALLLVGVVALSVFGCGALPTAPNAVQTRAAAVTSVSRTAPSDGLLSGLGGIVNTLVGLIVRTLNLVGSLGGSLSNGRWRVAVPAGAVDGSATVALGVANSLSSDCKLEIYPSDKNHFSAAATLTVDCQAISSDRLSNYAIYWFDPSTSQWVELSGSKVNLTNKTVSVSILHFSQYSVGPKGGRAGW
jgi:hypothetical protein